MNLDPVVGSEIRKTRPCVIVSANVLNARRRTVVVVPLSTSPNAAPPLLVPLVCERRQSVAVIDQIRAVSKERLVRRIDALPTGEMYAIELALRDVLDLSL